MGVSTGLKVREVLSLIPGTSLLAGNEGLNREVHSVGVMESPESLPFVKPGDLIMTALWAIRDDREAQRQLVPELVRRGAAGLAIKRSFVNDLPPDLLVMANRHAFPVLQLHTSLPFSEAIAPIIGQVVNRQASVLERQQRAQKAVVHAVLEAKGLQRLASTLAELVEKPVVIRDAVGQILATGFWGERAQASDIDLEQMARLEPTTTDYLMSAGDTLHAVEVVDVKGQPYTRIVTQVKSGNTRFGDVQVWELERPVSELDLSIVESVTTVIALELTNRRALMELERRYHNEFLAALFAKQVESEEELVMRARRFGWDLAKPHVAVALKVHAAGVRSAQEADELHTLEDHLYDIVTRSVGSNAVVGEAWLHSVLLMRPKRANAKEEAMAIAQQLQSQAGDISRNLQVTLGIGTLQRGVQGLRRSFQEARRAIKIGERVGGAGGVYHINDLGVYQILALLEPVPELQQFLASVRPLVQYDQQHGTELVRTLETYFAAKGNVRKVSESLFAHYNTVLYRLQRIEQITGISLEDANGRLYLQVALHAIKLFGPDGQG